MKIRYDEEADGGSIKVSDAETWEAEATEDGVFVDLDKERHAVGLEFLDARDFFAHKGIRPFQQAA